MGCMIAGVEPGLLWLFQKSRRRVNTVSMAKQETLITKKRRGPKPTGVGTLIGVRLQPDLLDVLDTFIADGKGEMSRPEALRQAFRDWAIGNGYLASEVERRLPAASKTG